MPTLPSNSPPDLTALVQTGVRRHALHSRDIALGLGGVATVTVLALFGLEPLITGVIAGNLTREVVRLWLGSLGANALAGWLASWGERAGNRLAADQALDDTLRSEIAIDLQRLVTMEAAAAQALAALVEQVDVLAVAFDALRPQLDGQKALLEALRSDLRRGDLIQGRLHQLLTAALDAQTSTILSAIQQGTDRLSDELRALALALREELRQGGGQGPTTINVGVNIRDMHGPGTTIGLEIGTLNADSVQIALPPAVPALHQLRAPIDAFVGREQETMQLVAALREARSRAVAAVGGVRGMGGIGKTELAYVVAHELAGDFPDAQLVVELRGASDPLTSVQALQSVIRAFEREARLPDDLAELQAIYRSYLAGKQMLILADNAHDAAQVRPLLPPPGSVLLVTSRYLFDLEGMVTLDLFVLPAAQAADLLRTLCPRITTEADVIARLCSYLPLALRVVAGLIKRTTRAVTEYVTLLEDTSTRLSRMRDPLTNLDVEASLTLSYDALDPQAQHVLCQLAVFPASFDRLAAAWIITLPADEDLIDLLDSLHAVNLLEYDSERERYDLHELVRAFALGRLTEEDAVRERYAIHYMKIAAQARQYYLQGGESMSAGLALFDRERTHIDAGWAWVHRQEAGPAIDELLIAFAHATTSIGDLRYDARRERIQQFEVVLLAAQRGERRADQVKLLSALGTAYSLSGDMGRAIDYCEQSLTLAREVADRRGESVALGNLGAVYADLGEVQQAIDSYEQGLVIRRELGDRREQANTLGNLATAYIRLGEIQRAIKVYEQGLVLAREVGNPRGEASMLGNLGSGYTALGEARRAIEYHEQSLRISRELGDRRGVGIALGNLGTAYATLGEIQRAIELYEQQMAIFRAIGDRRGEGQTLNHLGTALYNQGKVSQAIELYEQSLEIGREVGDRRVESAALGNLGLAYAALGEAQHAIDSYEQALVLMRELGDRRGEGQTLGNLGNVYYGLGEMQRAIDCYAQDVAIARQLGDRRKEGAALNNLGLAHATLGEVQHAIELYDQSLTIVREVGERPGEGRTLSNLGNAYARLGQMQHAIEIYEQVLVVMHELGDQQGEMIGSWNLGRLLAEQGDLARAMALMQLRVDYERSIGYVEAEAHAEQVDTLRQQLQSAQQHTDLLRRAEAAVERALAEGSAEERMALAEKLAVTADAYASGDATERALAARLRMLRERLVKRDCEPK